MSTDLPIFAASLVALAAGWITCRFYSSPNPIKLIPGPKSMSWFYGNMPALLLTEEYGEQEFRWQQSYGQLYAIRGCFGERRLMVSDPSTVQYILNSGLFVFGPSHEKKVDFLFGHGNVFLARGEAHRRLRAIMNPSFSANNVRASLAIIRETGSKLVDRWESLGFPGRTVDISQTLNDAALDVIGSAILDHPFDALEGKSELARIQRKLMDSASNPTKLAQLLGAVTSYIPNFLFGLAWFLPVPAMRLMRKYQKMTNELGHRLASQGGEDQGHSFIGYLVGRNVTEPELGVHLRSILVAGEDTVGSTLGWILYKLAQMPDFQDQLRQEIDRARPKHENDYNNMSLLNSIINEVLRLYSPFPLAERVATDDCILPLSQPITLTDGRQISAIPIKKGQRLYIGIAAFHRVNAIWGPDAMEFRPSRWLENEPCKRGGTTLGPHASLLAFLGGPGVCLGWRLAILELQVFVVELISRFVLSLPEDDSVRPRVAITIVSETADGTRQLPIHVENVA
ncbi:cytochrome P450 [Mycena maculata]|uniref:Cytochrome P450 n=1 Tax=Mycena maculata TaxID=230809 RepID=A0AAD7K2Y1_9AGAR|nr:cytochrome P450 [Mycena maculata]